MRARWYRILSLLVLASCLVPSAALAETVQVTIGVGETTTLVTGSTSPNATVTILSEGSVTGSTTADAAGEYSQLLTDQSPGLHNYQIYARDSVGRLTDTVSISTNVTEHSQTSLSVFLPPSIQLSGSQVTKGATVSIDGEAPANANIVLHIDDSYIVVSADATGKWHHSLDTTGLSTGEHLLYAVAVKTGGQQSYPTQNRTLIVDAAPVSPVPGVPPAQPAPAPSVPSIGSPQSGTTIDGNTVTLTGTAEPGTQIEIWNRGQLIGSVFADANGRWSITITLTEYANELRVRACRNNSCSDFSSSIMIYLAKPPAAPALVAWLNRHRIQAVTGMTVTIQAALTGGNPPYRVTINWGDGEKETVSTSKTKVLFSHIFRRSGKFNGVVTATDSSGRTSITTFSTEVIAVPAPTPAWVWTVGGISIISIGVLVYQLLIRLGIGGLGRFRRS